jgi:WD40 repeat protein
MLLGAYSREFRYMALHANDAEEAGLSISCGPLGVDVGNGGTLHSVDGRNVILGSRDRQLRLWDVGELLEEDDSEHRTAGVFFDSNTPIQALAADTTKVVGLSQASELCCWSVAGQVLWKRPPPSGPRLTRVALGILDVRPIIVTGSEEGELGLLAADDGHPLREPATLGNGPIQALSLHERRGTLMGLVSINRNWPDRDYVARVWDIRSFTEIKTKIHTPKESYLYIPGYRDKALRCVTAFALNDDCVISLAGAGGQILSVGLSNPELYDSWRGGEPNDYVQVLASGLDDNQVVIYAGDDEGRLFARNLSAYREHCPRVDNAHRGSLDALCVVRGNNSSYVVSGGSDGVINVWSPTLAHLGQIDTERPIEPHRVCRRLVF